MDRDNPAGGEISHTLLVWGSVSQDSNGVSTIWDPTQVTIGGVSIPEPLSLQLIALLGLEGLLEDWYDDGPWRSPSEAAFLRGEE